MLRSRSSYWKRTPESPAKLVEFYFKSNHEYPCLWAKPTSEISYGECRCSRIKIIVEDILWIPIKICCAPLTVAYLSPLYFKQLYDKVSNHEVDMKRRKTAAQAIAKKIPRILPSRIGEELFLTIGKDDNLERAEIEHEKRQGRGLSKRLGRRLKGSVKTILGRGNIEGEGKLTTDTQTNSILFRLPSELRRLIWMEAMGGYLFFLRFIEWDNRMASIRCQHESDRSCDRCHNLIKKRRTGAQVKWGNFDSISLLSLLETCRRIYSETIDILYRQNTFYFTSLRDVMKFSLQVSPQRMMGIKNVRRITGFHYWADGSHAMSITWLECEAPAPCKCIKCWGHSITLAVNADCDYQEAVELERDL